MRSILILLFTALASHAFGGFNIPEGYVSPSNKEEVLSPEVRECNEKYKKRIMRTMTKHNEDIARWRDLFDGAVDEAVEFQKEAEKTKDLYEKMLQLADEAIESVRQCEKEVSSLKNKVSKDLNMVQIVSRSTGKEGDLNTTLQIVENEFKKLSNSQRLELQLVLKYRGMYFSELDGIWGKDTKLGFLIYLSNDTVKSRAKNPSELFKEVKSGFVIDNLWGREDFEKDLEKDLEEIMQIDAEYRQEICRICSSGISSGSRSSSSSRSNSDDDSYEPFFKQMYINNELKNCLKVGNSWECD